MGQLQDCYLDGIAEVDRPLDIALQVHQSGQAFDQIVDVAERSRLRSRAVNSNRLVFQSLDDEAGNDPPILRMHIRAVGVENACDPNSDPVLAHVVVAQSLGTAFAFVIARAWTDHIHNTSVVLGLRVDLGIAVNFAGRSLQDAGVQALGQPKHIDRPNHAGLGRLHGVTLIVDW
jgi:hypothetical protein